MIRLTIKELVFEFDERQEPPKSLQPIPTNLKVVADIPENQNNVFWKSYIGQKVAIIKQTPDGLLDVMLPDQPIPVEGITPSRFT